LHEHPELSLREFRTAGVLADALRPLGFDVTTEIGGTGVAGLLRNGDGPVVMPRADIAALRGTWSRTGCSRSANRPAETSRGKTTKNADKGMPGSKPDKYARIVEC
jgi:metal-dependent amidase/aminoacylase/carboxypeptidase family protein